MFFSLLIFAKVMKHISEVPVCFSFYISVANFYKDGRCFLVIFFSLLILTEFSTNISKYFMNHCFFSFVTNCFPDVECAFIELLCLWKPALCYIFVSQFYSQHPSMNKCAKNFVCMSFRLCVTRDRVVCIEQHIGDIKVTTRVQVLKQNNTFIT